MEHHTAQTGLAISISKLRFLLGQFSLDRSRFGTPESTRREATQLCGNQVNRFIDRQSIVIAQIDVKDAIERNFQLIIFSSRPVIDRHHLYRA